MIDYLEHEGARYVELTIDGKVDRQSFEKVVQQLEPVLQETDQLGILKHIISFGGMEPSLLWDDLKFAFRNVRHVGPVAVVSDKKWIEIWTKLAAPFWKSEVRFFETAELEEARAWLSSKVTEAAAGTEE